MGIAATADAVSTALALLDLGETKTVARAFLPYRDREQLSQLTVTVMPRGIDRSIAARSGLAQEDHMLEVAVQKRLEGTDEAALAPLVAALETVAGHLSGFTIASGRRCIEVRIDPLLAEDHAVNLRVFTGVVQARFRTHI
jgi:hypothetical protein